MRFPIRYFLFIFGFLFFLNDFSFAFNPKSVGKSVDETVVYKSKEQPRTISDRSYDALTALKMLHSGNKSHNKTKSAPVESKKVFTLRTVNGEDITNIDVLNVIKLMFLFSGKKYDRTIAELMAPAVLDSLEEDKLRRQCANLFGIMISKKDVDNKVAEIAQNNGCNVSDLIEKIKAAGVTEKSFREHIKSKMIFQLIVDSFAERKDVSEEELREVKAEEENKLNSERYCIAEIFRYDEKSIKRIHDLIKDGFNFQILAENFSQNVCSNDKNFMKWKITSSIEPEVLKAIKSLNPGECSNIIKTKTGYKIIFLIDKAKAGKSGVLGSKYKILQTALKYKGKLFTEKDMKNSEELVNKILKVSTPDEFKTFCKEHNIKFEEKEMESLNAYYMELINRSRSSGKPAALQSFEDEDYLNVVFLISETSTAAKLPTNKELMEIAVEIKLAKEFLKNFQKIKSSAHVNNSSKNITEIAN